MIKNKNRDNTKEAHRDSILKSLDHRLEVAKANGQNDLIAQLEAEKRYYLK